MNEITIKFRNLTTNAANDTAILGRDRELRQLLKILLKPVHHHAVIVGEPGIGKSSLISLLSQLVHDRVIPGLASKIYALETAPLIGLFSSGGNVSGCYQEILRGLAKLPPAIIVIEDIQLLTGTAADRIEQTVSLLQMIADLPNISLIISTTPTSYGHSFDGNYLFSRIFSTLKLEKLPKAVISTMIAQTFRSQNITVSAELISTTIELAAHFHHGRSLPDTGIRLAEDIASSSNFEGQDNLSVDDVKTFVAKREGIPLASLKKDHTSLANIESRLNARVIGQPAALKTISRSMIASSLGLNDNRKPRGSFLLLGPSGVGKTETAKALTDIMYHDESAMIRLDMSEYSEAHTALRLTGSPPGYVGYESGGQLTRAVYNRPYSLVLLDEIEKAHPKLYDVFLQLLDDGRLTDSGGTLVDFTHTMVLATSNIGSKEIAAAYSENPAIDDTKFLANVLQPLLMKHFRPEFINRFDAILIYRPLELPILVDIAKIELHKLEERLQDLTIKFNIKDNVIEELIASDYNPLFGARPIKRLIAKYFEMPIAERIIAGTLPEKTIISGSERWLYG